MSHYADILKRLMAATGPDERIARRIWVDFVDDDAERVPSYTHSIDAALMLFWEKLPGWQISMHQRRDGWDVQIGPTATFTETSVSAPTLPLAILIALFVSLNNRVKP